MAATLRIISQITMLSAGVPRIIKSGTADAARLSSFGISVDGFCHAPTGTLASGSAATLWDGSTDLPATFDNGYFWADQDGQLQLIDTTSTGTNVILEYTKYNLLCFEGKILAAADEALMTAEETLQDVTIVVYAQTNGGSTAATWQVFLVT